MPAQFALNYLLNGLDASPDIQQVLCARVVDWDARPGPERFTVRESLAHLADWEPIWLQRMMRTKAEDVPDLPDIDEGVMAIEHDYASSDPRVSLERYRSGRVALVTFLRGLSDSDWSRRCHREGVGEISMFEMAAMVLGHDSYHFKHTIESTKATV
jgi:hypothetical protein